MIAAPCSDILPIVCMKVPPSCPSISSNNLLPRITNPSSLFISVTSVYNLDTNCVPDNLIQNQSPLLNTTFNPSTVITDTAFWVNPRLFNTLITPISSNDISFFCSSFTLFINSSVFFFNDAVKSTFPLL